MFLMQQLLQSIFTLDNKIINIKGTVINLIQIIEIISSNEIENRYVCKKQYFKL